MKIEKVKLFNYYKIINKSDLFELEYVNQQINKNYSKRKAIWSYLTNGSISPNLFFSEEFYLNENNDVADAGVDPFCHFIEHGGYEKRNCHPDLDFEYVLSYLSRSNQNEKHYFNVMNSDSEKYDEVEFSSFFKNYEQSITDKEIIKINELDLFDHEFYLGQYPDVMKSGIDALNHYLVSGFKEDRNPGVNFDTKFYRDAYQKNTKICPLVHYIRYGFERDYKTLPNYALTYAELMKDGCKYNQKIAIQAHLYYPEVISELLPLLINLDIDFDLLVSTTSINNKIFIENKLNKYNLKTRSRVRVVSNIGRDIAPLFLEFKEDWKGYDYICHLHSKKSPHTLFGHRWRTYLFDQIIGSSAMVNSILNYFEKNSNIGVIYPENYFEIKKFVDGNGNEKAVNKLVDRLGYSYDKELLTNDFPAGSMCWMRTQAFRGLIELDLTLDDFQDESGQVEGTLAHALERCFTIIPELNGYIAKKYYSFINDSKRLAFKWNKQDSPSNYSSSYRWLRDTPDIATNERLALKPQYPYFNPDSLNIHWIIPDFGIGAGGHMTIFRMIKYLEEFGHRQMIWIQNAHNYKNPVEAKECIQKHYQEISDNVIVQFLPEDVAHISGDIIIATDCWTVFPMMAIHQFKERFYLIQDWEPMFHPVGASNLIADLTYAFDLNALCAGKWLYSRAQEKGMWARSWDLAVDNRFYFPKEGSVNVSYEFRIAFYARAYTPRRAVMLGIAALKELHIRGVDIHVCFFGQDDLDFNVGFSHEYLGVLSPEELGELYREVDIGMVFSATNYSLIPLEMMACGLAILELDVESTRAVFDEAYIEMVLPDPLSIADRIEYLISHPDRLKTKAELALNFTKSLSWENSALKIESAFKEKLSEAFLPLNTGVLFGNKNEIYEYTVSVIIPTYNAGSDFEKVLNSLLNQKTDFKYQLVIVDSGSSDDTCQIIEALKDDRIFFFQIPNSEFQHGKTRNLAISKSKGEYVAVITQDAMPKDQVWLQNIVSTFERNPDAVGVFGAHEAYAEHSEYIKRDINRVFERFDMFGERFTWNMTCPDIVEPGSISWQFMLQYYSDNNSCMKKSVWEQLPYPEIDWGEDQAWAWMIIQLGLVKAYSKDAIVFHSHDDAVEVKYKTSKIEGRFFYQTFGLKLYAENSDVNEIIMKEQGNDKATGINNGYTKEVIEKQLTLIECSHRGRYAGVYSEV